ncbi:MAG: SUMF1/EgtB/PvdO family nonheme iron enzyme [Anaerolineae bacterium]|nr:SUMF1/EgtB/PvdO family nonheme iron enzyme [Anaerolineae bacterium]
MTHIFISYGRKDQPHARKLADHLRTNGFDVWMDDHIDMGDDWWAAIVRAIRGCSAFLVVMSPDAGSSRWVKREVMLAEDLAKPMFPVLLEGDLHSSELWALFISTQYTDFRGGNLPSDTFFTRLMERGVPRKSTPGVDFATQYRPSLKQDFDSPLHLGEGQGVRAASLLPPPFDWCPIPSGKVSMQSGKSSRQKHEVPAFSIAKYPITNAQYQVFLDAPDGFCNPLWWDYADHAMRWRSAHPHPESIALGGDDCPRTNVAWYDAFAFTRWLTARLTPHAMGREQGGGDNLALISLPTESQWQRAAQGDDGRAYPWGSQFDKSRANVRQTGLGRLTPVNAYPSGASPYEVLDMSGNVWEWCRTDHAGSNDPATAERRVLRGGSFSDFSSFATCDYRNTAAPDFKSLYFGFRIVLLTPAP